MGELLVLVLETRANAVRDANSRFASDVSIGFGRRLRLRPYSQIIFRARHLLSRTPCRQAQQQQIVRGTSAVAWAVKARIWGC